MATIHAKENPLKEVFSNDYAFRIPPYQRPYSWGIEQASALWDDILSASQGFSPNAAAKGKPVSPYFLGSIVLVKQETTPEADVIDGQQRLTTLALLLSALRAKFAGEDRDTVGRLLFEEGNSLIGTLDRCRLSLRERDHRFFEVNILRDVILSNLPSLLNQKLSDPQRKMAENCHYLLDKVSGLDPDRRKALAGYLLQFTFIVVVSTQDMDSAFRIFSVLNDRGLDLTVADILKAEIIGQIPDAEQSAYTDKWEAAEDDLGTQEFANLFSHIRMIYARSKLRQTVLEGFRTSVKPTNNPKKFIDDELLPLAEAFKDVLSAGYESADKAKAKRINHVLKLLHRLGDRDWVPAALQFLRKHNADPDKLLALLSDLERLAAGLWLLRLTENERIERHGKILAEFESGKDLSATDSTAQLGDKEKSAIVSVLDGDIYNLSPPPKRTMVLLRLDQALASGEAEYEFERITIEHVLPQTPPEGSEWLRWWPDTTVRDKSVHRLGNLALLNRRQNSAAKNWDFEKKKTKYFQSKTGGSPFQITSEVLSKKEWTPDVFNDRQSRFVTKLKQVWRLV